MSALAWCRPLAAGALALVLWLAARPAAAIQEIRIGVLSHRGTDLTEPDEPQVRIAHEGRSHRPTGTSRIG